MAELAIPILVLGTAYLYSNQNDENDLEEENFTNYKKNKVNNDNVLQYQDNINNYHDKYFTKKSTTLGNAETNLQADSSYNPENEQFVSLSGEVVNPNNVTHNNMTPFYSSRVTGGNITNNNYNEIVLDNYTGSGSQQIEKREIGSMFKPEENVQNAFGNQNANDFYQSRVNASLKMNNVKPWEEERVAPGLNKGFNTDGSQIGFNSGMEAREMWGPKTVDQLRVDNNPKMSYSLDGHMGPALNPIHERGEVGKMIKKTPDTYYENTPDKWFTTTGAYKSSTNQAENIIPDVNRENTSAEYYGVRGSGDTNANYMRSTHNTESKRMALPTKPFLNLTASDKTPASELGYGKNSYYAYNNNRTTTSNNDIFGNPYGNVYANIIEPVYQALRPTKKTNFIGNIRESGNVGVTTKSEMVYNPNDKPLVTNREMDITKLDFNHLNVQRQKDGAYVSNKHQPVENQRATTNYNDFGIAGAKQNEGEKLYDSAYRQTFNNNKQHIERTNMGNMKLFNPYMNANLKESNPENTRPNALYDPSVYVPNQQLLGNNERMPQNYNNNNNERMESSLLQAFKNNPYTQPIGSVA
tara:strand:+ start:223 stop:1971 length:1749 start_codon:yes stop_codon:yes gene_type:complete